ncbi:MAG: aldehyde dehydrogenase family protein [Planctomycetota bacterium]|jgi:succinate-semialdehyde dehydrogenase/glutarate-semialdehyde dehydrogenase|nr:aldehyde dehydrogenase family protein [Planctomycetota bacterium]MDP7251814.1 aldehyde dehydrogenase family protein [Planctomycetota bacterium]
MQQTPVESELRVLNPATGECIGTAPIHGRDEVEVAVERARAAQSEWSEIPTEERGKQIIRFRNAVRDNAEELMEAITRENGKTLHESLLMEVLGTTDLITWFARRAHKLLKRKFLSIHFYPTRRSYLQYVPRGVVGIISPWNFPFAIPIGQTVMALLAGNAVVLKPSEFTPLIALESKRLFEESGLPPDLFQIVTGDGSTGEALTSSDVNQIVFTGSVATGRKVAATCAERLIPCTLELGGKAPAIVLEDADIRRTAGALLWGAFSNAGQACASVERVYAHESIHDELVAEIKARTEALRQGDPNSEVDVGSMIHSAQLENVERLIASAIQDGASVICGGERADGDGEFFPPTVLDHVKPDSDIMKKEIFGPVMPIATFTEESDAIRMANDSTLGLLAYVFTRNRSKGRRIAEQIEAGTVMVNDVLCTFALPETPWHGIKDSGLGIVHSAEGLKQLCELRHIHYERIRPLKEELWWYPYTKKRLELFKRIYRWLYSWIYR